MNQQTTIVYKNGTYKTVPTTFSWEYQNDPDWLVTIPATEPAIDNAALKRVAKIVRTNWGDDALQAISKVLDDALPGWLDRSSPRSEGDE